MNHPVQIGRSYKEWWFLALIGAGIALCSAGAMLLIVNHRAAGGMLIAGGVALFSAWMSAIIIARSRFQIETMPGGFLVRDRLGERRFTDDQVICASLSTRPNFTNGVLKSTTRTFDVWLEGESGAQQLKLINAFAVGQRDPLGALVDRILSHLYERARAALEAQEPFEGEGWTLNQNELVVRSKHAGEAVSFNDLAAADIFDNHVCVWKHGQDEPVLRIPVSSANTPVLLRILQERIAPHPEGEGSAREDGLGRILFERKPRRGTIAALWVLPLATLVLLATLAIVAVLKGALGILLAGIPLVLIMGLVLVGVLSQCIEFRVHEHGVRRKWLFRTEQLKFTQVDTFTYSAVPQYYKGVYTGTMFRLTFTTSSAGKQRKLTYSKGLRNADADLERLREVISQLIAERMEAQFSQGRAVMWTAGLRFLPEGLEYRAAGIFGRKPPVVIPYSQIWGCDANQGFFWLWVLGQKRPAAKESVAQPNFFPGYLFLTRLLASRPATPAPAAAPQALPERAR
ncbi:MAG TPA: hypothetical protein VKU82_05815 [Planctomycetaceae bacterium]|nr:hypothetical protein [Planctomycetaceae bacterium]